MSLTFEDLREWAEDRATHWALDPDGGDRLEVDGLPVAAALRVEVFNLLLPLGAEESSIASDFGTPGPIGALKRHGVDRAVRAWGLRALAAVGDRGRPTVTRGGVAFLSEFATPSMMAPMRRVAAALTSIEWRAACADPRTYRGWDWAPSPPRFARRQGDHAALILPWREERTVLQAAGRKVAERWADVAAHPPAFEFAGVDLTDSALQRLGRLVRRSTPWLVAETLAIRRFLDVTEPRWLVLASDQHRLGRIATNEAARMGVRTLVLQHGMPQYAIGYVPVVADEVATWSEASDAWFIRRGTSPERLVRLGNPRVDELRHADLTALAQQVAARFPAGASPRILVALSPSDLERNRTIVRTGLEAVAASPTATLIIKLHPGDGRWAEVRDDVLRARSIRDRVAIAHREPLSPLLCWADLVFLHRSTVAVEALAAGTPVAIAGVGASSSSDALEDDLRLPTVDTARELLGLASHLEHPADRVAFVESRRVAVERTVGPLDGRSAERIARHLEAAA